MNYRTFRVLALASPFFFPLIALSQQASGSAKAISAPFVPATLPAVAPAGRPVVGLALEGGGALGLAHVGVLQWMEEHRIPVDRISGTSMGSLVAGLYASGATPEEMKKLALSGAFLHVFTLQTPYTDLNFRRRQDRREMPESITVGLAHGVEIRNALVSDSGVDEFLTSALFSYNRQEIDYNRLPIPFRCVATDLTSLRSVTFDHGPIPQAVRASISIPGVFPPVEAANGDFLVDGGILDNLPTGILRSDLHADKVIAVHLQDAALTSSDTSSIVSVLNRAFAAGISRNVEKSLQSADLVIEIPVYSYTGMDYGKAAELIPLGYKAAESISTKLLPYALSEHDWQIYLADRAARRLPAPGKLLAVEVAGGSVQARQQVQADLHSLQDHQLAPGSILQALKPVQSNGDLAANYELFSPDKQLDADASLLVRLRKDSVGPPFLLVGADFLASTSNVSRAQLSLRLVDQNFGGYGSELRTTARMGYSTELSTEYYRLLNAHGYFLQPEAQILRTPIYIWQNQKRIGEYFQQDLTAGLNLGRTISRQWQIAGEWRILDTRWSQRSGSGGGVYLQGSAQSGVLHLHMERATSGTISPDGFHLDASAGSLYHAAESANAPLLHFAFGRTRSWRDVNIFGLSAETSSYLRANVAQPYRFTLGGPMRLSAASFEEYRGTDLYLARAGWMRRIASLPTGLGQGLYTVFGYEAGEIWSPESSAQLRQDAVAGLLGNTPIGVLTLGAAAGDAGHRKVFVSLGRFF